MYNFNFLEDEKLIDIFENVLIKQNDNEKTTTIALTNKRILFLDYINTSEGLDALRIARGIHYTRYQDVYYQIDLNDIEAITKEEYYQIILNDETTFEFNNTKLYQLLTQKSKSIF